MGETRHHASCIVKCRRPAGLNERAGRSILTSLHDLISFCSLAVRFVNTSTVLCLTDGVHPACCWLGTHCSRSAWEHPWTSSLRRQKCVRESQYTENFIYVVLPQSKYRPMLIAFLHFYKERHRLLFSWLWVQHPIETILRGKDLFWFMVPEGKFIICAKAEQSSSVEARMDSRAPQSWWTRNQRLQSITLNVLCLPDRNIIQRIHSFPKTHHLMLRTMCSNTWTEGGQFSFKP